ncbi:MAG: CRTAC1 family protein, partial [Candidatus Dadabacteria bacterium]|nr:CRTAC1 family protein [Candidatus Dadabacteria bacterium]
IMAGFKSNIVLGSFLITLLSFGIIGGCGGSSSNSGQSEANIRFTNVTTQAGLSYAHGFTAGGPSGEPQLISGGVALGDYDGDGWVDLYVVRGTIGPNLLFRNLGNGSFQEVGQSAGLDLSGTIGSGPTFADFSGDGLLDLFIGGLSPTGVSFFLNNGNGTFSNITAGALETAVFSDHTYSAAFGDYDHDNDLDLFMTHWGSLTVKVDGTSEHLWRNNGDNTFTDVSIASGIAQTYQGDRDWTFTPNFADINNDGHPDILIAADFGTSQVFINQTDGTFVNTTDSDVITDENGMGAAIGDYDNDGDLDWFVSSIYDPNMVAEANWGISGNRLYRNNGDGTFEDVTLAAGVEQGFWGWGSCFADFDNDGNLDLVHVNGFGFSENPITAEFFKDPTRLWISNGDGTFTERALELGLDDTGQGRGIVCFDYDKDGDIDIFIANNNQSPKLFRNDGGNTNNFLNIKLNGLSPNTEGVGARITITINNQNQMRELRVGSNFVSQNPVRAHFGLGNAELVNQVQVDWADGETTVLQNVSSNQFLEIDIRI